MIAYIVNLYYRFSQLGLLEQNITDWVSKTAEIYLSQSWRLRSPKIKALADLVSGEDLLPDSRTTVSWL